MWSLTTARPFDRLSMRRISLLFLALGVAFLGTLSLFASSVQAQEADDSEIRVTWSGENLTYDGITLSRSESPSSDNNLPTLPADRCGGTVFYSQVRNLQSPEINDTADEQNYWLSVVCFEAGDDGTDRSLPSDATLFEYSVPKDKFNPATDSRRKFNEARSWQIIIPAATIGGETDGSGATSCDSTFTYGMGWIVCPVSNFLASGMDWLFDVLKGFLIVREAVAEETSVLYRAWGFVRNVANILFVIGFLVIIYSQLTSIGISNYGVKRMLPRLVIAAILVNISFYIAALGIDLSNIIGMAVQDMFETLRHNLVGVGGNGWEIPTWQKVTSAILAGGTLTIGAVAVGTGVLLSPVAISAAGGALLGLLPLLVIALLSLFVAVMVMAARQALITILVILSPLAFVAYLLPSTEKYFDKWKDVFITMLLVFPMFSMIFGGSQLAASAIIQNADRIEVVLLGLLVQVAPLAITPLLINLSGSVLARFAGIVNNPNKGLVDRTRKFTDERRGLMRARAMSEATKKSGKVYVNNDLASRMARRSEFGKRNRAKMLKAYEQDIEGGYLDSIEGRTVDLKFRVSEQEAKAVQEKLNTAFKEAQAGEISSLYGPANARMRALVENANDTARFIAVNGLRQHQAELRHRSDLTEELLRNTDTIDGQTLREYAGGIRGAEGADTVFAGQIAQYRKEASEKIGEQAQLMRHFQLSSTQYQNLALGDTNVTRTDSSGHTYTFDISNAFTREAAVGNQLKAGSYGQIEKIIEESGYDPITGRRGATYEQRETISQAILENNLTKKAVFWGSRTIDDVNQGKVLGRASLNEEAAYFLVSGKVTDEALSTMSANAIEQLFKVANQEAGHTTTEQTASPEALAAFNRNAREIKLAAKRIMDNELLRRNADTAAQQMLERYRER